ncbi:hypothetical protein LGN12_30330 [Burkholderia multivorans]|nr:hypothetical protein [Burkholderia multivorans]
MSNHDEVPHSFPRKLAPGGVPGVQPKLLVRQVGDRYSDELTDRERLLRYRTCEDLACQLREYVLRKVATNGFSLTDALARAERGLKQKVDSGQWDFSLAEVTWVTSRIHTLVAAENKEDTDESE